MLNLFYEKNKMVNGLCFKDRNFCLTNKEFIGKTIFVYNGKKFIPILIKENMLNCKVGTLVINRTIMLKSKVRFKKKSGTRRKSNKL